MAEPDQPQSFLRLFQSGSDRTGRVVVPSGRGLMASMRSFVTGCVDIMSLTVPKNPPEDP